MNISNNGVAIGHVSQKPFINLNKDGSRKIFLVVGVQDNFKNSKGERGTQFINLEAFVKGDKNGVYDYIYKGSKVGIAYRVESNSYKDAKTGEQVYRQVLSITDVELMDNKETAERLKARAEAEATGAEVPADVPKEAAKAAKATAKSKTATVADDAPFPESK